VIDGGGHLGHLARDIGVLAREHLVAALEQGHAGAEDGEHRGELAPDVPATEDQQRLGPAVFAFPRACIDGTRARP